MNLFNTVMILSGIINIFLVSDSLRSESFDSFSPLDYKGKHADCGVYPEHFSLPSLTADCPIKRDQHPNLTWNKAILLYSTSLLPHAYLMQGAPGLCHSADLLNDRGHISEAWELLDHWKHIVCWFIIHFVFFIEEWPEKLRLLKIYRNLNRLNQLRIARIQRSIQARPSSCSSILPIALHRQLS